MKICLHSTYKLRYTINYSYSLFLCMANILLILYLLHLWHLYIYICVCVYVVSFYDDEHDCSHEKQRTVQVSTVNDYFVLIQLIKAWNYCSQCCMHLQVFFRNDAFHFMDSSLPYQDENILFLSLKKN